MIKVIKKYIYIFIILILGSRLRIIQIQIFIFPAENVFLPTNSFQKVIVWPSVLDEIYSLSSFWLAPFIRGLHSEVIRTTDLAHVLRRMHNMKYTNKYNM